MPFFYFTSVGTTRGPGIVSVVVDDEAVVVTMLVTETEFVTLLQFPVNFLSPRIYFVSGMD